MTLFQLTLKNLRRRRTRTLLTIMGIGLGIGAVVALLGLAWGLEDSWSDAYKARKTDLVVRRSAGGLIAQPFSEEITTRVRKVPGVAAAAGLLTEVLSIEKVPMMVVSGREWGSFLWDTLKVVEGRLPKDASERGVVLGTLAAEMLEKKPGDKLGLEIDEFEVLGIVDGGAVVENGSVIVALPILQEMVLKEGDINFVNVRLNDHDADPHTVAKLIEKQAPGCRVDIASEVLSQNDGVKTFQAMNWGTSIIAILVGAFGVMNTMFMSVFERTREIGILLALGWKRSRILRMILLESVSLCLAAGIVGVLAGLVMLKILEFMPWMQGRIEPAVSWQLISLALGLAVAVGLGSGLYPALHCTRINPSLAIRQL
ncbi:MAG: ABC transporter permease [Verrucomicrobiales bacterium]|nr:ABC transporter permease [Verrucomicrobiales bacterium]